MSEEKKIIPRLGKAAKEYNVATSTIVEYLKEKGHVVENNDNTKLTPEMYELVSQKYQSERDIKEESEKIEFGSSLKSISSTKETEKEAEENINNDTINEVSEVVVIKTTQLDKIETDPLKETKEPDFKIDIAKKNVNIVGKIDLSTLEKPKKTNKTEKKATETKAKPEKKTKEKSPSKATEKEVVQEEIVSDIPDTPKEDVVIDSVEKQAITETVATAEIAKDNVSAEDLSAAKSSDAKETKESSATADLQEDIDEQKEVDTEDVIILKAPKFDSKPKVVGKIDLSNINTLTKPAKKTKEELLREKREKREKDLALKREQQEKSKIRRKKEEAKKQETISTDSSQEDSSEDIPVKKVWKKNMVDKTSPKEEDEQTHRKKRKRIKPSYNKDSDLFDLDTDRIKRRKDRSSKVNKIDFTEEEIDKQVRKTLARLAPLGKTKSSKHRKEKRELIQSEIIEAQERSEQEKNILKVTEFITANELAIMMNIPVTQIISTCMSIGMAVAINQRLDAELITLLAEEFGYKIQFVGIDEEEEEETVEINEKDLIERSPIVTVMGHVDHGKTSLLDYIRKTNVIAGESGGITQHIGAYEVRLPNNKRITFLDTPGHEAFTAMRARGAKVTDIVIIVIASDDTIMPQTIEAINHAQAANVPMIFAINKIDKPNADPEKIRGALANMNLLVEEWGGKIQSQNISAKKGINVDLLLEKVLIEAEMLDLKANPNTIATGTVVESALDKGRGYVAKILVQNGTLYKGDIIAAGTAFGKIKAMHNERNQLINEAGPSTPVLILGLNNAPQAGDTFKVYKDEREAKNIVNKRIQLIREQGLRTQKHITLDEIGRRIAIGDFKELNIIVKGDVDGSIEALSDSLLQLSTSEVQVNIIHKSVGQVTESDILLASASDAIIIAFQVRPSAGAKKLAEQEQVDIRTYSIIYDAINELKDAIKGMHSPEIKENIVCNIEVREIFHISKVGTIAGCYVLDGKIQRNNQVRIIRDGIVIYTGRLGSLKRFKDDVKEVTAGYECGLNIVGFNDVKIGDIIEGFEEVEVSK